MEYHEKQLNIIAVAEKLFAEKGYDGTSVRDIAQEAGVNIAMISYYFGSKEKLLEAVFGQRSEGLRLSVENALQDGKLSPLEKVYRVVEAYVERIARQQCFHKIMVREQMSDKSGPVSRLIFETKLRNHELIERLIREGQEKGDFMNEVDIPLMMNTMIGTALQLFTTQHYYREINNLRDMEEEKFQKHLKDKLLIHMKKLFKSMLTQQL